MAGTARASQDLALLGDAAAQGDARAGTAFASEPRRPRLGFLGVGWIGRNRMEAIAAAEVAEIVAVADASVEVAAAVRECAPAAAVMSSLDALLDADLDGIVIATPSAFHADQAEQALERDIAVFCQKPLGRDAQETRRVVEAARAADRLLAVDLSYRYTHAMQRIADLVWRGQLGRVHAVDLVFHNAYGPDKAWFYDRRLSGGGCVIDLGVHLVDLALWVLAPAHVTQVTSHLFARGERLEPNDDRVEDHAVAQLTLDTGAVARLACSWNLPAGCDCVIEASFYGADGGAALRNVNGSFYDFTAEHFRGTSRDLIASPPDAWGGRAAVAWACRLAEDGRFDPEIASVIHVAETLDAIYGR